MNITAWILFLTLAVISRVQKVDSLCNSVNNAVKCSSVTRITKATLGQIGNIDAIKSIEIDNKATNNTDLFLASDAFESAINVESIVIKYSNISKIFQNTFKGLPLRQLHLKFSEIKEIFPGAFENLSQIQRISLFENNLKYIPKNVFNKLPVQEIVLSKNRLKHLDDDAFEELPNLTKLKLDNNALESVFIHRIVTFPNQLEILWLHNNSLTSVTNHMLKGLNNLKVLNLGFNSIYFIEANAFEQTRALQTLVLTHNDLKEVDGSIFPRTGLQNLEKLYLDNNKLMYLSTNFFVRLLKLKKITIVGNPWLCPCLERVQILLAELKVTEKCAEDYTSGKRPICVSKEPGDMVCRHIYDEELRETYEEYKRSHPLYRLPIYCLL